MPRNGAELQSLGVLLTELGDIGFPEPSPRAPSGTPGLTPVAHEEEGAREMRRVQLVESHLLCDPGHLTPDSGLLFSSLSWWWARLGGGTERANLSLPGSSEPPGASTPAPKERQRDKRASPALPPS